MALTKKPDEIIGFFAVPPGNQFLTSQSDAIEKIINVLKNSIDDGLASTESKIQF